MSPGFEFLLVTPEEAKFLLSALAVMSPSLAAYLIARTKYEAENRRAKTEYMAAACEQARLNLVTTEDQARQNQKLEVELNVIKALLTQMRSDGRTPIPLATASRPTLGTVPLKGSQQGGSQQDQEEQQQQLQCIYQFQQLEQQAA